MVKLVHWKWNFKFNSCGTLAPPCTYLNLKNTLQFRWLNMKRLHIFKEKKTIVWRSLSVFQFQGFLIFLTAVNEKNFFLNVKFLSEMTKKVNYEGKWRYDLHALESSSVYSLWGATTFLRNFLIFSCILPIFDWRTNKFCYFTH